MNYSPYTMEQVFNAFRGYKEICDIFMDLAKDDITKNKIIEILYQGGYNGKSFRTDLMNRDNPEIDGKRRIAMANLLIRNPETFEYLMENGINLFHGTNANAIPSIIKYGLNSVDKSTQEGINVTTGEVSTRIGGKRDFASLTDDLDLAKGYAGIKPREGDDALSFPAFIGTTKECASKYSHYIIHSETPELGIKGGLKPEEIKVVCVPSDKVDFIKKIVDDDVKVLASDGMEESFYFIDDFGIIFIDNERLNKLKEEKKKSKKFTFADFKNLAIKRTMEKIKNGFKRIETEELENASR